MVNHKQRNKTGTILNRLEYYFQNCILWHSLICELPRNFSYQLWNGKIWDSPRRNTSLVGAITGLWVPGPKRSLCSGARQIAGLKGDLRKGERSPLALYHEQGTWSRWPGMLQEGENSLVPTKSLGLIQAHFLQSSLGRDMLSAWAVK